MIGGYSVIAGVINDRFAPHPPVNRRRVYNWHHRGTLNYNGDKPPAPVRERLDAPRSQPRYLFEVDAWLEWFRPGVPAPHNSGWLHWVEVSR